jgi:branched-chain amino acid transport system permease protein
MFIEMLYHITLDAANGPEMDLFGRAISTAKAGPWLLALLVVVVGAVAFRLLRPGFLQIWGNANTEIEDAVRKGQA